MTPIKILSFDHPDFRYHALVVHQAKSIVLLLGLHTMLVLRDISPSKDC
jgi:hypothetical protein